MKRNFTIIIKKSLIHFKTSFTYVLFYSGFYQYLLRKRIKKGTGLIVLAYHSVTNEKVRHPGLEVTAHHFAAQIKFLKRYFKIVGLGEGVDLLEKGSAECNNKVVLTFDDGYRDNYTVAFPVLCKHAVPATIFLTTDPIAKHGLIWGNELDILISTCDSKSLEIDGLGSFDLSTSKMKLKTIRLFKKHIKSLYPEEKRMILDNINKQIRPYKNSELEGQFEMLLPQEIMEMSSSEVSFGSHTCTHPIVSKISDNDFAVELIDSRLQISEWTGENVFFFAYPNGQVNDFTEGSKKILRDNKFKAAFTLIRGTNLSITDKYELKRIPVKDCPLPEFVSFILKYI